MTIVTGNLAGYNTVRAFIGLEPIEFPVSLDVGDIISFENKMKETKDGIKMRYTFTGASYFERMKELNLYTIEIAEIEERVERLKMKDFFKQKLI